mmetsp:Transcript_1898/g.4116  ORF Transcript_1898/g.4116 Transcript_1898/m.4116 type:complete len:205 (-) Transcript_1898:6-620(-)
MPTPRCAFSHTPSSPGSVGSDHSTSASRRCERTVRFVYDLREVNDPFTSRRISSMVEPPDGGLRPSGSAPSMRTTTSSSSTSPPTAFQSSEASAPTIVHRYGSSRMGRLMARKSATLRTLHPSPPCRHSTLFSTSAASGSQSNRALSRFHTRKPAWCSSILRQHSRSRPCVPFVSDDSWFPRSRWMSLGYRSFSARRRHTTSSE